MWQLLRVTGLHTAAKSKSRTRTVVQLDREFRGDLPFWKWAIEHRLVDAGESLSAPFYAHAKRPPTHRYISDSSLEAIGGYCPDLMIFWRCTLSPVLTRELKRKARERETSAITINLLELYGMFMTTCVVQMFNVQRGETQRTRRTRTLVWEQRLGGNMGKQMQSCSGQTSLPPHENEGKDGNRDWLVSDRKTYSGGQKHLGRRYLEMARKQCSEKHCTTNRKAELDISRPWPQR